MFSRGRHVLGETASYLRCR